MSDIERKQEPVISKVNDELLVLNLAKSQPDGVALNDIQTVVPHLTLEQITTLINKCLKNGSLELLKAGKHLFYKYRDAQESQSNSSQVLKGIDTEEKVVYRIIEDATNKGIWIRDIRFKSNLNMTQLNKVLRSLETKKLIKAIKSVSASKKKVYMLYNLEPDSSVTGGAWYQDQDFESEFVDVLNVQCARYLNQKFEDAMKMNGDPLLVRNRSYATAADVHKYIADLQISRVSLSIEDIESILYTVVLDGAAERTLATSGSYLYRAVTSFTDPSGLVKTMCGICPIYNRCAEFGSINPRNCSYITDWLANG